MHELDAIDLDDAAAREELAQFLAATDVPFHVGGRPAIETARERVASGSWGGAADEDGDHRTYWLTADAQRVGVVRLDDLSDGGPMFDLRIADAERGRGHATAALVVIADRVFGDWPDVDRVEGQTREDNVAMRRAFVRGGWTKEAHYRRGWPVAGGEPVASIAYAILREEWRTGERIPLVWDDLPR